jgi:lantibiotic biosynthesis protein
MRDYFCFHPQLLLRTPAKPFALGLNEAGIWDALADPAFREAIYLASPVLHAECEKWRNGELTDDRKVARLRLALARYCTRITSRCTPFGLFAGCSLLHWGTSTHLEIQAEGHGRHTRLDMHYLGALAQRLAVHPDLKFRLRYQPNTSLYLLGTEIRYVERHYHNGDRTHQISALEASNLLLRALVQAEPGRTLAELEADLLEEEAERVELATFLEALVDAQVLVSELEPTVTGVEFFTHLYTVLARLATGAEVQPSLVELTRTLDAVQQALSRLDEPGVNEAVDYEAIEALLAPLGVPLEPGKLFQTDALHGLAASAGTSTGVLDQALQAPLEEALAVLACLTPAFRNPRLENFVHRFQVRYEDQAVPLLEALDTESGLAYTDYGKPRYSSLVHDLTLPAPEALPPPVSQEAGPRWLRQQLQTAARQGTYSLNLSLSELRVQGLAPPPLLLPPSLAVLFRFVEGGKLLLESVGGSSSVNLLGRFAHAAPTVGTLIQEITAHEQACNPEVCFAEIAHLPANRVGNLLQRPHFRALEIPYLAQSTRPRGQQVRVQDLTLAMHHGQLVLRERCSGRRIVPRLSSAHNFGGEALPVYQLLGDLQTQGIQPQLGIAWETIAPDTQFTPRLSCGSVVLAAATWRLDRADYRDLLDAPSAAVESQLRTFRAAWQLPQLFTLVDGDNELLVDTDNELLVRVWLEAIRSRPHCVLKEFLCEPTGSPVRDIAGRPHAAQAIALLLRQTPCYAPSRPPVNSPVTPVPREFVLGSEWLYYKLYCGQTIASRVLLEVLRPLAAQLRNQGLIDNWFFVRYADPDPHLRVRWHLPDPHRIGELMRLISEHLAPVQGMHAVWKVQADTYRRELERYGSRSIDSAEVLFGAQTDELLKRMMQSAAEEPAAELWLWGLNQIDALLTAFEYSLPRKFELLAGLQAAMAREFGVDKALKQQLDAKYRAQRRVVQHALSPVAADGPQRAATEEVARRVLNLAARNELEVPLDELLGSYIHMLLNRLLPTEARLHELVLYDFLHRHYQSDMARRPSSTFFHS